MAELKPIWEPLYTIDQVAEAIHRSRDTVTRRFENLPGVIDDGWPERRHKRRYRGLRIPRSVLLRYLDEHRIGAAS
jgi:hypothetical protein